jgi:hypothetical protein
MIQTARRFVGPLLLAAIVSTGAGMAIAADVPAGVTASQGDVSIVRADSGRRIAATVNTALHAGDYIETASGANAELHIDGPAVLRLSQDTQVRLVSLAPGAAELQLASGTADFAEPQGMGNGAQIDTPSVTVRPLRSGEYRISVTPSGETVVTVSSGEATVTSSKGSQTVTPGSVMIGP